MTTDEMKPPSVGSNQWHHVNWWHYCEPRKQRLAFRTDVRAYQRHDKGLITTLGEPIECETCGIKGTFVKSKWVPE